MTDRFRTRLDWEDVRFFVALARHRSLSATARALTVNHATVARRIGALERALGAALFERRPDGYELTTAGRDALAAAGIMEDAAEALPRSRPAQPLAGLLRLATTPGLAESFLIPRLATFQALHPALDIEVAADRRSVSLARREADIALRLGRPEDGTLILRRLAAIRFGFYAAPAWRDRLARGEAAVFVGFDAANAAVPEAAWLSVRFPAARVGLRATTQSGQLSAARAGCGIALLPHFLAADDQGLVPIALGLVPPERTLWLLTRDDAGRVPRISQARDFLVALFEQERPRFEGAAADSGRGRDPTGAHEIIT